MMWPAWPADPVQWLLLPLHFLSKLGAVVLHCCTARGNNPQHFLQVASQDPFNNRSGSTSARGTPVSAAGVHFLLPEHPISAVQGAEDTMILAHRSPDRNASPAARPPYKDSTEQADLKPNSEQTSRRVWLLRRKC
ncbi:uncharacterized protein B0T15DRAFT_527124 [Chaetomium strumarium]|uniref:Secreted protein n=1 Tax=Chaetomium strumarium TaxID=1170767 RepID=A0AAJ0M2K2_9PEZI|nr:hypothetical protein B0T15DRAFT_527124 [Chaetomium strumarium]